MTLNNNIHHKLRMTSAKSNFIIVIFFSLFAICLILCGRYDNDRTISKEKQLWDAVKSNQISRVTTLLREEANVDSTDKYSSISNWIMFHFHQIIKMPYRPQSLLMFAVSRNQDEIVEMLIRKGANPDYLDSQGESALDIARKNRNMRSILFLSAQKSFHIKCRVTTDGYPSGEIWVSLKK